MKLAYVHAANMAIPSANGLQVSRMCQAFRSAGAEVTLWYPRYASPRAITDWQRHYDVAHRIDARPLPTLLTERLFASSALPALKLVGYARIVASYRFARPIAPMGETPDGAGPPDLIFTRCFAAAAFFPRALRAAFGAQRPRVVFEAHELPPSRGRARALREVDAIVSITHSAADDIVEQLEIPRAKILVAPDGVPASWIDTPLSRIDARAELGLGANANAPTHVAKRPDLGDARGITNTSRQGSRPVVVYTGTFQPGTAELLHGLATHAPEVDVIGVGLHAAEARVRVAPRDNLSLLEPVSPAKARLYQAAADVLVMPHDGTVRWSRYTSPLKLFEYMAARRPIVASHLRVLEEIVKQREHALLVPVGDARALAEGVRVVLGDHVLATKLAENAVTAVRAYTWEARARSILDFIAGLA